ncbi:MAG TPA: type IV toxin-antitoxin system AbiEi family antitoxin domain-containing protein [Actinospica sp.]|nr:type IV toxin-antitoxin system AbiEi family antitoxin domain-containing protein [Actinospica sp.]
MAINAVLEEPTLSTLINSQHGVLTAAQAKAGGLAHETLRRRVQRGLWQRLVPGVYALQGGPPSRVQWLMAAQLYAGEQSVLTGQAALAVHGLRPPRDSAAGAAGFGGVQGGHCGARPRLDALVPHTRRRQSVAPLRIIRTTRFPEATRSGLLRVAPLARSVVDGCLAAVADGEPEAIDAIVTAALEDGRVQLTELEYELAKAPRQHSAAIRAELRTSRAHVRATASQRLLARLGTSGPFGAMQDVAVYLGQRRVARAVALWPGRAVAVLVDAPPLDAGTLTSLGFAVIQVASEQLTRDNGALQEHIRAVLEHRPEARLSAGLALLPLASQRDLTASSPARIGAAKVLPWGGRGQT